MLKTRDHFLNGAEARRTAAHGETDRAKDPHMGPWRMTFHDLIQTN